jgi:hypothetical protein
MGRGGILTFPDLLAPSSRQDPDDTRFLQDYGYSRERPRSQSSSLFDTSSFNVVSIRNESTFPIFQHKRVCLGNSINFITLCHYWT